jgi:hypothetical protein
VFEDSLGIEDQTEDDPKRSEGDEKPSWWVGRWAHVLALPVFCIVYFPFQKYPWAWHVAIASSYSVFVFCRAFGTTLGDADDFFGNSKVPRLLANLVIPHVLILALIVLGVSLWFHLKPNLPSWVTHEGRKGSLWDLCGWLLLAGAGIWQGSWMAAWIKRHLNERDDPA